MNDRSYWEKLGKDYDSEVFDVFANDTARTVASQIEAWAGPRKHAADFGCGVGKFLPLLSDGFATVRALDFSKSCLRDGENRFRHLTNVAFQHFDMCSTRRACGAVDFILSVNALLTPALDQQLAMFKTLSRHLKPGGHLVLVVPAMESALLAADRMLQWNLRSGMTPRQAAKAARSRARRKELDIRSDGVVEIDGAATKHYRREELIDRLGGIGFEISSLDRVEYSWATEFNSPPRWMKAPLPWDWCVSAARKW